MLVVGLTHRWREADSRVEQSPEGEGAPGSVSETVWMQVASVSCHRLRSVFFGFGCRSLAVERTVSVSAVCGARETGLGSSKRQEGNGVGDGVRLHGRNKALKGATP